MPERRFVRTSTRGDARGDAPHARGDGRRPSPSSPGDIERVRKPSSSAKRDGEDDKCLSVTRARGGGSWRRRSAAPTRQSATREAHQHTAPRRGRLQLVILELCATTLPPIDLALRRRDGTEGVRGDASTTTGGELDVRRGARHRPAPRRGGGGDVPPGGGDREGRTGEPPRPRAPWGGGR